MTSLSTFSAHFTNITPASQLAASQKQGSGGGGGGAWNLVKVEERRPRHGSLQEGEGEEGAPTSEGGVAGQETAHDVSYYARRKQRLPSRLRLRSKEICTHRTHRRRRAYILAHVRAFVLRCVCMCVCKRWRTMHPHGCNEDPRSNPLHPSQPREKESLQQYQRVMGQLLGPGQDALLKRLPLQGNFKEKRPYAPPPPPLTYTDTHARTQAHARTT